MMLRKSASFLFSLVVLGLLPGGDTSAAGGTVVSAGSGGKTVDVKTTKSDRIGKEMYDELVKSGGVYPDAEVQGYVNRLGQKLARNSSRPDIKYTFTVVDNEAINAYATPGGYVYVNRGLMIYLDNEAELAGVVGHEIGHITERHSSRQQTAGIANSVLSQTVGILTGSRDLMEASNMYGTSLVRGYGRDMELEADSAGAQTMHRAGYDPEQMLEVIGVLKDQETYNRAKAKAKGRTSQTYHGLYSTHPRNDKRLQTVILAANELEDQPPADIDPREFRAMMEGLAYGKTARTAEREEGRFYHNKLKFTFSYPPEWQVDPGSKAIVAKAKDGSAQVKVTIKRRDKSLSDRDFLDQQMDVAKLFQSTELNQARLKGTTGISPPDDSHGERRLALINYGSIAYLFEGTSNSEGDFPQQDALFMDLIESFRPMQGSERQSGKPMYITYIQADGNTSFAQMARKIRVRDAEVQLRLMNGYYPRGEPRVGEWIKIIKQDKN